ncbi:MAG: hypothetical protein NUW37_08400, partial [Planctomycetes bacterium]|nr:hypothetical protein [Planctomycetota bacterium]
LETIVGTWDRGRPRPQKPSNVSFDGSELSMSLAYDSFLVQPMKKGAKTPRGHLLRLNLVFPIHCLHPNRAVLGFILDNPLPCIYTITHNREHA